MAIIEIMIPTITMTTAISIRVNPDRFVNLENGDLDKIMALTVFTFNGFLCSNHKVNLQIKKSKNMLYSIRK